MYHVVDVFLKVAHQLLPGTHGDGHVLNILFTAQQLQDKLQDTTLTQTVEHWTWVR